MTNFCPHCGAAAGTGKFCGICGKPITGPAGPIAAVAPVPPPKQGSGLKIVLLVAAVLAFLAVTGIVGAAFYVKHRIHQGLADLKERTGIDLPAAATSRTEAGERRDGCLLLTKGEAQGILEIPIIRAEGGVNSGQDEHCYYYTDSRASQHAREQAKARFDALRQPGANHGDDLAKVEELMKGITAGTNDGTAPILEITVFRGNGKMATVAFNAGAALLGTKAKSEPGPWDEAIFGPLDSTLTVRKGDNGIMIDLRQVPDGHEKGMALANRIAPRLTDSQER